MQLLTNLLDFLFPKSPEVYDLESLSSGELVTLLPPAREINENTLAIWNYADPRVRHLVWELKYRRNGLIAEHVAEVLYDVLRHELVERALFDHFVAPLLLPMPQSELRRLERGFNQTEVLGACLESLARSESERVFEYAPHILEKTRHTSSQTKTANKRERLQNVLDSMQVPHPELVKGRNIILLDDVTTTGATFKDAKRALHGAGARRVLCLALAH